MTNIKSILSFDIGTRHLAYCALHHTVTPDNSQPSNPTRIHKWQVVDLMSIQGTPYDEACIWVVSKSWKIGELRAYLDGKNMSSVGKRDELIKRIHGDLKKRKIKKVTSTNLCVLASKLYAYLDTQPWMLQCDVIVLENQPCMTNPVMKSVQMLLYGYFLYNGVWKVHQSNQQYELQMQCGDASADASATKQLPRVMLTSATNKLKLCKTVLKDDALPQHDGSGSEKDKAVDDTNTEDNKKEKKKNNYKQRKKDAIELTQKLLKQWLTESIETNGTHQWEQWIALMNKSCMKEKDDLSDSFLQGLYVLHQHVICGGKS